MLGCGFIDLSGTDSLHSSYKPFQLSCDRGEKSPTPSQQPAKGPKLCADVTRVSGQNTDGLLFEQTNAVTFPCACYILKTTVINNHTRPAEFSR